MKTVLVTGSSKGIGYETIKKYAENNYNVVITYKDDYNSAIKLEKEIKEKYNINTLVLKLDLTDEENIKNVITKIKNKFNNLDILVNNASIAIDTTFEDKNKTNFMKILEVNLVGTFLISKYASQIMSNNSNIINISSTNGIDSYYIESLDYDASKAGVISLTHNLANQLSPKTRVNCICPGWVNTNMNKNLDQQFKTKEENKILLNRFANPREIANVVYFLTSEEASYINDSIIKVDGGVKYE